MFRYIDQYFACMYACIYVGSMYVHACKVK